MVLRRILGPSLETGGIFDAALSGNYCANCDSVSVMAVREKCDERGRSRGSENPMRETAGESHPFRRVREKDGARSEPIFGELQTKIAPRRCEQPK